MNEHEQNRLGPIDDHETQILIDIKRISTNNRGEPLTWGSTPLVASSDVKIQQQAAKSKIGELFEDDNIPNYVSQNLAEYIDVLNMSRTVKRETLNQDSFVYREKIDLDGIPLEALEVFNRAVKGFASPAELLFIQKLMGVPSIELASLTHPYGQRIEMLKEMRPAVNEAIVMMGGTLVRGVPPTFEVIASDNPHNPAAIEGIHMTRKTLFGHVDDTEIVERSSFVILLDQLPPERARAVRALPFENNKLWAEQVGQACGFAELAPLLLDNDEYDKAIPVSTTVVAKNAALGERLLSEEAKRSRIRKYMASHASKI